MIQVPLILMHSVLEYFGRRIDFTGRATVVENVPVLARQTISFYRLTNSRSTVTPRIGVAPGRVPKVDPKDRLLSKICANVS
jgi:hypothetical protein